MDRRSNRQAASLVVLTPARAVEAVVMAQTTRQRKQPTNVHSFDVTCVIGSVVLDPDHEGEGPHVVAMKLIAEHDAPGTYSFPMIDGRTQRVTVEFVGDDPRCLDTATD